jgi:hypothetical protein
MKKLILGTVLALVLIATKAQAQVVPQPLPNSAWCVGDGTPGTDQVTLIATSKHFPGSYCVTITVGGIATPYEVLDLSQFGWDNDFHLDTVWNAANSFGDYFTSPGLTGPFQYVFGGRKVSGMRGLGISSLRAWHQ